MNSPLQFDQNGLVRGFPYHDGFLDGVLTGTTNGEVHLALRSSQQDRRVLTLRRVSALHVEGFREGNIVLNLWLLPKERLLKNAEIVRLLAERLDVDASKLASDAIVFRLDASFGADVLAVCGEAEISGVGARIAVES
jgi:hypothetical protein